MNTQNLHSQTPEETEGDEYETVTAKARAKKANLDLQGDLQVLPVRQERAKKTVVSNYYEGKRNSGVVLSESSAFNFPNKTTETVKRRQEVKNFETKQKKEVSEELKTTRALEEIDTIMKLMSDEPQKFNHMSANQRAKQHLRFNVSFA